MWSNLSPPARDRCEVNGRDFQKILVFLPHLLSFRSSLVVQTVKNLSAMRETQVRSLGWEDPLEEGMATHSSIFACRIPWTEEPGGLQSLLVN